MLCHHRPWAARLQINLSANLSQAGIYSNRTGHCVIYSTELQLLNLQYVNASTASFLSLITKATYLLMRNYTASNTDLETGLL